MFRRSLLALLTILLMCSPHFAHADSKFSTATECTQNEGVWVIVEYEDEPLAAGCAINPTHGIDALRQIGITIGVRPHQPGFVCELQGRPLDACRINEGFDRATGSYWSYWHQSAPKTSWLYSQKGAKIYVPPAGSVEGWAWGNKKQPKWQENAHAAPEPLAPAGQGSPLPTIIIAAVLVIGGVGFVIYRQTHQREAQ